ncbi:MAG: Transcriptional regulator [Planctomycetaceae bacterium]|nr:Transcriptional regulator [Planctomycetaceae bacterium]
MPYEPSKLELPKVDSVRLRIVSEARRHFLLHGFRSVTMADLATELGMSKKTLYTCFSSKVMLVEAVVRQKFDDIDTELEKITAFRDVDFLNSLQQMLACVQKHTDEVQPSFVRDIQRESPALFQLVEGRRREIIQRYFGTLFTEGQKRGMIRKDVRVDLVVAVLLAATQAIVNPATLAEFGLTPTTGFTTIIRIVLEGVLTAKGKQLPLASE